MGKKKKNRLLFILCLSIPLMIINYHAYQKLMSLSHNALFSFVDNPVASSANQLAIILSVNIAIIVILLFYILFFK